MINLLPTEKKRDLRKAYRVHLVIAGGTLAFLLGVFSVGMAGIVYWGHTMEYHVIEEWIAFAKGSEEAARAEEIRKELDKVRTMTALLSQEDVLQEPVYERVFLRIAGVGTGVVVRGIDFEVGNEKNIIHVRGVAATREDLVGFARALEAEGFSGIDIPVGSFISENDIEFSLTFQE